MAYSWIVEECFGIGRKYQNVATSGSIQMVWVKWVPAVLASRGSNINYEALIALMINNWGDFTMEMKKNLGCKQSTEWSNHEAKDRWRIGQSYSRIYTSSNTDNEIGYRWNRSLAREIAGWIDRRIVVDLNRWFLWVGDRVELLDEQLNWRWWSLVPCPWKYSSAWA